MEVTQIVESLNAEIEVLTQVRHLLAGTGTKTLSLSVSKKKRGGKRTMSAEARERIAAAQRKRWAKQKAGKKAA